ncbi:MAG: trypsin-like peptidase domain-containing protein [Elusimicrobia bacterium]|nr:trypsin-like peptidase domain-containing protein [Elusimicrobiota bacterium]
MIASLAAAVLTLSLPLHSQEFAAEMGVAHDLVLRAQAGRPWLLSHKNGILQQINDALAHLTAESKPSVGMIRAGDGTGTGFIVDASGLMITNSHVVLDQGLNGKVKVLFADGNEYAGVVVALGSMGTEKDPFSGRDLAVIRLPARAKGWPALALGDAAKLREGDMVAMMGYPMGLPFTLTQGVVSGLDHREGGIKGFPVKFVQSDASINPGNSGGPLVTMDGTVVGVNTLTFSPSGGSDGLSFSVGVDAVKGFLAEYKKRGSFSDKARSQTPRKSRGPVEQSGQASCPAPETLSQPWIEHTGPAPRSVLDAHLNSALDGSFPGLLNVNAVSWWIGASRRGRGNSEEIDLPGCFVRGSAALYVNGPEDAPTSDFVKVVSSGSEASLRAALIELRWYDAKDGRKHRWFDVALAKRLGWDVDGRGAPTDSPRPISLPDSINELL